MGALGRQSNKPNMHLVEGEVGRGASILYVNNGNRRLLRIRMRLHSSLKATIRTPLGL